MIVPSARYREAARGSEDHRQGKAHADGSQALAPRGPPYEAHSAPKRRPPVPGAIVLF
jgi:hypothetical protein